MYRLFGGIMPSTREKQEMRLRNARRLFKIEYVILDSWKSKHVVFKRSILEWYDDMEKKGVEFEVKSIKDMDGKEIYK